MEKPLRGTCGRSGGWTRAPRPADGVSFRLEPGETLGLVGESGGGKSTVARLILRLVEPTAGPVRSGDVDLTALRDEPLRRQRRDLQMVFQDQGDRRPALRPGGVGEVGHEGNPDRNIRQSGRGRQSRRSPRHVGAPAAGEVVIALEASPINQYDLLMIAGGYGYRPPLPAVMGTEGVGRVVAVGSGVKHLKEGGRTLVPFLQPAWPSASRPTHRG